MISQADIAAAFDRARQGGGTLTQVLDRFDEELCKLVDTKSAAPGAANTENGKVLGTEITISIEHMTIIVKKN